MTIKCFKVGQAVVIAGDGGAADPRQGHGEICPPQHVGGHQGLGLLKARAQQNVNHKASAFLF